VTEAIGGKHVTPPPVPGMKNLNTWIRMEYPYEGLDTRVEQMDYQVGLGAPGLEKAPHAVLR